MKKGFIKYSLLWLVALGLFNAAAFLLADRGADLFWIGYGAVSLAFVLQLISTALFFKKDLLQKRVVGVPVPVFCMMSLVAVLIAGVVCVMIPNWIVIAVCYVVVVGQYVANIVVLVGAGKNGAATGFIADLKKNTAALAQKAENAEIKALAQEVSEAAASADPFSDVALAGVENKILGKLAEFSACVENADVENAKTSAKQLLSFIKERNAKCRILK